MPIYECVYVCMSVCLIVCRWWLLSGGGGCGVFCCDDGDGVRACLCLCMYVCI